jgi:hypothetical protein
VEGPRTTPHFQSDKRILILLFLLLNIRLIIKAVSPRSFCLDEEVINLFMQASSIELTAKKSHYGVDGTGRDTYINFDNGGNYRGYHQLVPGKFERG